MKSKKNILFLIVIIAALAGAAFYFLYFIRTPAYALNAARSACQEHDVQKFEHYVDVNSVMDNAFDDIIKGESKINNDNIFSNPFAVGILRMLKPTVVDLMAQEARDKVANVPEEQQNKKAVDPVPDAMRRNMERRIPLGKFTIKDLKISKTESERAIAVVALHNKDLDKDFIAELDRNMERRIPLGKFTIKDLKISKTESERAIAVVALHNKDLDKDFIAELELKINDKGDWQIKRVSNLAELIVQIDAAKKAKLAASNKPIMDKLNAAIKTINANINIPADGKQFRRLETNIRVKNTGNVGINRMYYDVMIFDENNKEIYSYPENFQGEIPGDSEKDLNNSKKLSRMLPDDKALMERNPKKLQCRIQVTYLVFDDGTVLSPNAFME